MFGLDGFEVKNKLLKTESTSKISLIFLTAKAEIAKDEMKSLLRGNIYILKPYNSFELLYIV